MALKHSESRVFAVELGKIEEEIKSQRFHTMVDITPTKSNDVVHIYWYEHDVSLSSFGEKIMIQLQEINADSTRVDITSESLQASKMIDVGSNQGNVIRIFKHLEKLVAPPPAAPAQPVAQPQAYTPPVQQTYVQPTYTQPTYVQPNYVQPTYVQQPPVYNNAMYTPQYNGYVPPAPVQYAPQQMYVAPAYVCRFCGSGITADTVFCPGCGARVGGNPSKTCTHCGYSNALDAEFCLNCGLKF